MKYHMAGDHGRFKEKIKDLVKKNLEHLVQRDNLKYDKNGKTFSIPLPRINIPHFRFADRSKGGAGQGEGDIGDPVYGPQKEGSEDGAGGESHSEFMQVEMPVYEAIDLLIEGLGLPFLEPEEREIEEVKPKYTSRSLSGPRALVHRRETLKRAIKRSIITGSYNPSKGVPIFKEDFVYKHSKEMPKPNTDAVIFYVMDCSGSMDEEKREVVKNEIFLLDHILERLYQRQKGEKALGIQSRYIIHTSQFQEVASQEEFLMAYPQGGTLFNPALTYVRDETNKLLAQGHKNIYCFQYSDGEYFSDDLAPTLNRIDDLHKILNMYAYTEIGAESNASLLKKV